MKRLLIASIVLAMAAPAFAQSTRTQPQTRTTDPDSTITESQKGGPASKEFRAGRWWSADSHQAGHAKRCSDARTCASPLKLGFTKPASGGVDADRRCKRIGRGGLHCGQSLRLQVWLTVVGCPHSRIRARSCVRVVAGEYAFRAVGAARIQCGAASQPERRRPIRAVNFRGSSAALHGSAVARP